MHVTAAPAAQPVGRTEHLAQHRDERDAAHDQGGRAAVGEREAVAVLDVRDHAGRDGLLAGAEVHLAGDQPAIPQALDGDLVGARTGHLPEQFLDTARPHPTIASTLLPRVP